MSIENKRHDATFEKYISDQRRHATETQCINVDFLEYCNRCWLIQAVLETTIKSNKPYSVLQLLARQINCYAYVMLLNNWQEGKWDPVNYQPEITVKTVYVPEVGVLKEPLEDYYSGREAMLNWFHQIHRNNHRLGCPGVKGANEARIDGKICQGLCCQGRLYPGFDSSD